MNQNANIELKDRENEEMEIDLIELFGHFMSKLRWVVGAFIIGALIAGLLTMFVITPKYTATAKMYMVNSSSQSVVDLTDLNIGQSLSGDYVELLKTRPIVEGVIEEQNLQYSYRQLVSMVSLSIINETRIVQIDVTSTDPREAMEIANSLADKGVSELPKLMETPKPHIAEYAIVPVNQSSPSLTKNVMIGALLGLLIMLGILTVQFLTDDTFKSAEDIEREFGIMPITVIPEGRIEGLDPDDDKGKTKTKKSKSKKRGKAKKSDRSK